MKGAAIDTTGTKSSPADTLVVVLALGDWVSHFRVTRLNRVTQMCGAEMPGDGFLSS
jgi:hypothetical protein